MPEFTFASILAALASLIVTIFNTIVSTLKASYDASHKWFAVGCGIFIVLVYLGYAHLPKADNPDAASKTQIEELSKKVDALSVMIAGKFAEAKSAQITTGSVPKHKK